MSKKASTTDAFVSGDLVMVWKNGDADYRLVPSADFLTWIESNFAQPGFTTQRNTPITGFSVNVTDSSQNTHLVLTPAGTLATGTIVLPATANSVDKQEVLVTCSETITTLTVNGNGSTVTGGPTTMGATSPFKLRYDLLSTTWNLAI